MIIYSFQRWECENAHSRDGLLKCYIVSAEDAGNVLVTIFEPRCGRAWFAPVLGRDGNRQEFDKSEPMYAASSATALLR